MSGMAWRRRRRRRRIGAAVVLLVAAGAAFGAWRLWGGPDEAEAGDGADRGTPLVALGGGASPERQPAARTEEPATPPATDDRRAPIVTETTRNTPAPIVRDAGAAPGGTDAPGTRAGHEPLISTGAEETRPVEPATTPAETGPATRPAQPALDGGVPADIRSILSTAENLTAAGDAVKARELLNRVLMDGRVSEATRADARGRMAALNDRLLFSQTVDRDDPLTANYRVQGGDSLSRIATRENTLTPWQFIARVNGMSNPNALRAGQNLKLVRGPFHAVVDKSDFRLDLYAGPTPSESASVPENGIEPGWIYIRSFRVGLGADGGTPTGAFVVRENSKATNPSWVNPEDPTERYASGDPENPIGRHWLGIRGVDEVTRSLESYGLHGTIEPESIGQEMSMGCVRLEADDIALLYDMLIEGRSAVRIVR